MKKILAIDDQQENLTTIKAVINSNMPDCNVLTALSGKEGIEIAGKEQPDTILLDVIMPGMDGYEVCKKLKENELTKHIPVVMITAIKTNIESRVNSLKMGADAFLSKPIDPVELSAQVRVMLRIKEAEDKLRANNIALEKLIIEKMSELKESKESLLKEQYFLTKAQEMGNIGTWEINIQKDILKWSDENYKIFGVPLGTEMNLDLFLNCIHPDDRDYVNTKWNAGLNKEPYDIEHRLIVNDKIKWVREKADIEFDAEGNPVMAIGFTQDITENKLVEIELQVEKDIAQKYLDIAGVMFVVLNENGEITLINKKGCEILGYSYHEILNKNWFDLCIHKDVRDELRGVFNNLFAGRIELVEYYENSIVHKNGDFVTIAFHNTIIRNEESKIIGVLFSGENITERKQTEGELEKYRGNLEELVKERTKELEEKARKIKDSQLALTYLVEDVNESRTNLDLANRQLQTANKDLESFSYSVSHDLRAPLRHIDGFTKLMYKNVKDNIDEKTQNYFDNIISSSKQMNQLIDDLLIFSRMTRKDLRKTDANMKSLIEDAIQIFESDIKENKITVIVDEMPDVNLDVSLIKQVWVNLISNAIKFAGHVGNSEIHIGTDTDKDGSTIFFIKDNGVGFDQKYVDKIFDVFHRLHNINDFPGTGIGLANVKRIIMKHGGEIRAEGKINKGASFFYTLPNS